MATALKVFCSLLLLLILACAIGCGGEVLFTDHDGNTWEAEEFRERLSDLYQEYCSAKEEHKLTGDSEDIWNLHEVKSELMKLGFVLYDAVGPVPEFHDDAETIEAILELDEKELEEWVQSHPDSRENLYKQITPRNN